MEWFSFIETWQDECFDSVVAPLLFHLGLGNRLEMAYDAMNWFAVGLLQLAVIALVFMPLERMRPVEPARWDRTVWVDVIYTIIHRLGFFSLFFFFSLQPLIQSGLNALRMAGLPTFSIDQIWPGVTDEAWVSFLIYLVVLDAVNYFYHRLQHQWEPLWALHALHHSQRHLNAWTDNRNHFLDDILHATVMSGVALLIGVEPSQFLIWVALAQLCENLQHANVRLAWWPWLERLVVSPRFHRLHHAIGIGHEFPGAVLGGHNFGVLLPWWDLLFKTARFDPEFHATGIRDQVEFGRDYGQGVWSQQWLGLVRLSQAVGIKRAKS